MLLLLGSEPGGRSLRGVRWLAALLVAGLLSCGGDEDASSAEASDAGSDGAAGEAGGDAGGTGGSAGTGAGGHDASPDGDGGEATDAAHEDPCLAAPDITDTGFAHGTIDPNLEERNHFRFRVAAGDFVRLRTESYSVVPPNSTAYERELVADPAVTLLTEDGSTVLAANDNVAPLRPESEIVYRAAEDATLCLRVEHVSSWMGTPPTAQHVMGYDVFQSTQQDPAWKHDTDAEPNDDGGQAQGLKHVVKVDDRHAFDIVGMLGTEEDVDVYRLHVPEEAGAVELRFSAHGSGAQDVEGNGSTLGLGRVDLTDEAGEVLARADAPAGATAIRFPLLPAGEQVLIWVRRAPGTPTGTNDFYRLHGFVEPCASMLEHAEAETGAGQNDTPATAEPSVGSVTGTSFAYGYLLHEVAGFLAPSTDGGDVDHWAFDVFPGSSLHLSCWSTRVGSGVVEPAFAIVDGEGVELRSGVETADRDFVWSGHPAALAPPLSLPEGGTYYLRARAEGQQPDVASRWYECSMRVFVP